MTPSARLQATLDLLIELGKVPRPADALVSGYFRARRYIGSKDRAAVAAMFYDVLRHHARLEWWLNREGEGYADERRRMLTYLALVEGRPLKEIGELFDGKKFSPDPLEEDERKLLRKLAGHTAEHPSMPDTVKGECPDWAAASLQKRFGKTFLKEARALLAPAPLDIRINALRTTRDEMLVELKAADIKAAPCRISPWGIRIKDRPALTALPMLKKGLVEIQDEGSQLVGLIVDAAPGHRVVDFCAGAGGKTLAIAAQMKNKGRILACDVLENRLKRSAERFRRAGVHNIETRVFKNERDPYIKRHKGEFDRVLADVPCSGIGAWRRNPDSRWRSLGPGLANLLVLQQAILESAARLVKPGGRLIYATCSLLPEENEMQIEKFLAAHEEFRLMPVEKILEKAGALSVASLVAGSCLSLTPAQHETDGFFGAVMERIAPVSAK